MSFIALFVNDMIVFDVDELSLQELIANLGRRIRIEDKSVPESFLGKKFTLVKNI